MDKHVQTFLDTLTFEILDYHDCVDWEYIKKNVEALKTEVELLQAVIDEGTLSPQTLAQLLVRHPKILLVLKLLIAHTPDKIYFSDNNFIDFINDVSILPENEERAVQIAKMFEKMGLLDFLRMNVNNLEDLLFGIFIGLEPNNRKNRRGRKFEFIVDNLIRNVVSEINKEFGLTLKTNTQIYVDVVEGQKLVDYMISLNNRPFLVVEVNFYSTAGSKPSEVIKRAYVNLQKELLKKNVYLVVITDGRGWLKMQKVIQQAFEKLRYIMNIRQAQSGKLKEVIVDVLKQNNILMS